MAGFGAETSADYARKILEQVMRVCPAPLRRLVGRVLRVRTSVAFRLFAHAQVLASSRQYQGALKTINTALRFQPRYVLAHELRVQLLVQICRYERALDACARALELNGRSEGILASVENILPVLLHSDHPDRVIQTLNRCLRVYPQHVSVMIALIELLSKSHRYRDAVLTCERLLDVDPDLISVIQTRERIIADPEAKPFLHGIDLTGKYRISDQYNRLVAGNVTDLLVQTMTKFYSNLGVDTATVPLIRALNDFRKNLSSGEEKSSQQNPSTLVAFERAWAAYQNGQTAEALRSFEMIFSAESARRMMVDSPFLKEAVIRSGEIWGRHLEKTGDIDSAISIYRQILSLDGNGVVARRLLLLLSRRGKLRDAANLAETAIISRTNLYPRLLENPHIENLKKEMFDCAVASTSAAAKA